MDYLIHHMFQTSTSCFSDKEALVDKQYRHTFEDAAKKIAGLAEGLRTAGLRRGERVGIYLETSVLQALLYSASLRPVVSSFRSTVFYFRSRWHISREIAK